MSNDEQRSDEDDIEQLARRRVRRITGLATHALVYVCVNFGLYAAALLDLTTPPRHLPLLGWGLGLAIHAIVVLASAQTDTLRRNLLQREISRLRRERSAG